MDTEQYYYFKENGNHSGRLSGNEISGASSDSFFYCRAVCVLVLAVSVPDAESVSHQTCLYVRCSAFTYGTSGCGGYQRRGTVCRRGASEIRRDADAPGRGGKAAL